MRREEQGVGLGALLVRFVRPAGVLATLRSVGSAPRVVHRPKAIFVIRLIGTHPSVSNW